MRCRRTVEFSCRERTAMTVKKRTISRAKRSAGTICSATRSTTFGLPTTSRRPRRYDTTLARPAVRLESRPADDHPQHNGRAAPRASVPRQHHGHRHAEDWHHGCSRIAPAIQENRFADYAATGAERIAVQPPQAHHINCQKANDLGRAAVGWNGGLGGTALSVRPNQLCQDLETCILAVRSSAMCQHYSQLRISASESAHRAGQ